MLIKKIFIFSLAFFLISAGFLFTVNFAFAGQIQGSCSCHITDSGERTGDPIFSPSEQANDLRSLATACVDICREMGCPPPAPSTNECDVRVLGGSVSCVTETETLNTETGVCTAASTPAPTTSDGSSTKKTESAKAVNLPNPLGTTDVRVVIGRIIRAVMGIIGSIALLMFMYGGFMWMTASGDSGKIKKGQQTIVWATIGLAMIFISYTVVNFVLSSLTNLGGTKTEQTE